MKNKLLRNTCLVIFAVFLLIVFNNVYAASASVSLNKTSATVGDSVTATVTINAAAWNVKVSGAASDSIVGYNEDGVNQTKQMTYKIDTSKAGTYTISISGDVTDGTTDANSNVTGSATVTVKAKSTETNTKTNTNTNTNTKTNTVTTTKSSNSYLSVLKVNVDGLSPNFNKYTNTYSLTVGKDVNNLTLTVKTEDSKAKYYVTGNSNFKAGDNYVKIVVTAENGSTRIYNIIVTKAVDTSKANAYLTSILVNGISLEGFDPKILEYTLDEVSETTNSIIVTAFAESKNAIVEVSGNDNLIAGENKIIIKVTAEDKATVREYVLKVNKKQVEEVQTADSELNIYNENNNIGNIVEQDALYTSTGFSKEVLENNTLLIIFFLFGLVEFIQVVYLYLRLRKVDPSFTKVVIKEEKTSLDKRRGSKSEIDEEK